MSGIPGSGKTTFVNQLVRILNEEHRNKGAKQDIAIAVSMDGYHLPKSSLDKMKVSIWVTRVEVWKYIHEGSKNPQEAYARRGAHWTFDPNGILDLLQNLRDPENKDVAIRAPSFDHAKGDPVTDDIEIHP